VDVYLLVQALPALVDAAVSLYVMDKGLPFRVETRGELVTRVVGMACQGVLGAWLLLGARGLSQTLVALQHGISRMRDA
jgi:hypothetical protein